MNKYNDSLKNLIQSLSSLDQFPQQELISALPRLSHTQTEYTKMYQTVLQKYHSNPYAFREVTMVLFIVLHKKQVQFLEKAIQFFKGMIKSRLVMLTFDAKGVFYLPKVLSYINQTLEVTINLSLQQQKEEELMEMIRFANKKQIKFNEINFILEAIIISKIQKCLDDDSLRDFRNVLANILSSKKLQYFQNNESALRINKIAILRQYQDTSDVYYLQIMKNKKMNKVKQSYNPLAPWIKQAYVKKPQTLLNIQEYRNKKVSKVYQFLNQLQIYASSPLLQQFDFSQEGNFNQIFQSFLLGQKMGKNEYQFNWLKMREDLNEIRLKSQKQSQCYKEAIMGQINKYIGSHEQNQ